MGERAAVKQRKLRTKLNVTDEERKNDADAFDTLRKQWEEKLAEQEKQLAEERSNKKARNLAPLAKMLRLDGVLPRSIVVKALDPNFNAPLSRGGAAKMRIALSFLHSPCS